MTLCPSTLFPEAIASFLLVSLLFNVCSDKEEENLTEIYVLPSLFAIRNLLQEEVRLQYVKYEWSVDVWFQSWMVSNFVFVKMYVSERVQKAIDSQMNNHWHQSCVPRSEIGTYLRNIRDILALGK